MLNCFDARRYMSSALCCCGAGFGNRADMMCCQNLGMTICFVVKPDLEVQFTLKANSDLGIKYVSIENRNPEFIHQIPGVLRLRS